MIIIFPDMEEEGDLYKQTGVTPSDGICVPEVTVALCMNIYMKKSKREPIIMEKNTVHNISN